MSIVTTNQNPPLSPIAPSKRARKANSRATTGHPASAQEAGLFFVAFTDVPCIHQRRTWVRQVHETGSLRRKPPI